MRLAGHLMLACMLLAILETTLAIVSVLAGGLLLTGLVTRPRETLRGIATITATLVVVGHPVWSAAAVVVLILGARPIEKWRANSIGA